MFYIPQIDRKNLKENYHSSDSYDRFIENKKRMPHDWFYNKFDLNYEFNEIGYRSPRLESLADKEFFVVFGCSNTEGIGLRVEDTYSYILSQKLKLPYLNFGRGGASINFIFQANTLFCNFFKKLPKFVIIQWPEPERYAAWDKDLHPHLITSQNYNSIPNPNIIRLYEARLLSNHNTIKENFFNIMATQLLWKKAGCGYIDFSICQKNIFDIYFEKNDVKWFDYDEPNLNLLARDLLHPGIQKNLEIANNLLHFI